MSTLETALEQVKQRITRASVLAARHDEPRLIAVSKTYPSQSIIEAYQFGLREFGENYAQELSTKSQELNDLPQLVWHFIGPLQSNKTKQIAEHADWVHSLDRVKIAQRLSEQRPPHLPDLNVLIQVNISQEPQKSGVEPTQVLELLKAIHHFPRLNFMGLMGMAEASPHSDTVLGQFQRLAEVQQAIQNQGFACPHLSMGMSQDMESAIAAGSTMIRIGSAIFGARVAK